MATIESGPITVNLTPQMRTLLRTRINYPVLWAEPGDQHSAAHYNQLVRLLIDLRDQLDRIEDRLPWQPQ